MGMTHIPGGVKTNKNRELGRYYLLYRCPSCHSEGLSELLESGKRFELSTYEYPELPKCPDGCRINTGKLNAVLKGTAPSGIIDSTPKTLKRKILVSPK